MTFHALGRAPEVLLESRPGSLQAPQCQLRPAQDEECRWGGMHALPLRCEHRRGAFRTSRGQIQLRQLTAQLDGAWLMTQLLFELRNGQVVQPEPAQCPRQVYLDSHCF